MPKHPAKKGSSTPSRSTYWFLRKSMMDWAIVIRFVACLSMLILSIVLDTMLRVLEPTMVLNKGHDLFMGWHEVCAAMFGDQDCTTGISQACSLVPVPSVDETVQETRGKCVTSAQDIFHLHRETWHLDLRSNISIRYKMDSLSSRTAFLSQHS